MKNPYPYPAQRYLLNNVIYRTLFVQQRAFHWRYVPAALAVGIQLFAAGFNVSSESAVAAQHTRADLNVELDVPGTATEPRVLANVVVDEKDRARVVAMSYLAAPWHPGLHPHQRWWGTQEAEWGPLREQLDIALVEGAERQQVLVGFKLDDGREVWRGRRVYLYEGPPEILLEKPESFVGSRRSLSVSGKVQRPIESIHYHLENAHGVFDPMPGRPIGRPSRLPEYGTEAPRTIDPEDFLQRMRTAWFECADIPMAPGENRITLRVRDRAGYLTTKTITYFRDDSVDTEAPEIAIHWPSNGSLVFSDETRLRGVLGTGEATVRVRTEDGLEIKGTVSSDGYFAVRSIPMKPGTNRLTLRAMNRFGNQREVELEWIRSEVTLTIYPPTQEEWRQGSPVISGAISHLGHTVWVNGSRAEMNRGEWTVPSVRLPIDTRTGRLKPIIEASAIPNTINRGDGYGAGVSTLRHNGNPSRTE